MFCFCLASFSQNNHLAIRSVLLCILIVHSLVLLLFSCTDISRLDFGHLWMDMWVDSSLGTEQSCYEHSHVNLCTDVSFLFTSVTTRLYGESVSDFLGNR